MIRKGCDKHSQLRPRQLIATWAFIAVWGFSGISHARAYTPLQKSSLLPSNTALADTTTAQTSTAPTAEQHKESSLSTAFDPESPVSWLYRMVAAIEQSSFELIFVVNTDRKDTLPYRWRKGTSDTGVVVEQLSLLNGPGFEQIAFNHRVSIYEPGLSPHSVPGHRVKLPMPDAIVRNPEKLMQSYDVILMGRHRIVGQMARQLRIVSKDKSRYGYYLWLDENTGLPLKLNTYDLAGKLLMQVQVTQLEVSTAVNEHFVNFQSKHLPELTPPLMLPQRELTWSLAYLPKGMEVVKTSLHRISQSRQPAEYMLLSDGVVDVSVYLLEANAAISDDVTWQIGQNSVVSKTDGRVQVSIVGNIPVATANKIANSIVLLEPSE